MKKLMTTKILFPNEFLVATVTRKGFSALVNKLDVQCKSVASIKRLSAFFTFKSVFAWKKYLINANHPNRETMFHFVFCIFSFKLCFQLRRLNESFAAKFYIKRKKWNLDEICKILENSRKLPQTWGFNPEWTRAWRLRVSLAANRALHWQQNVSLA